jgi:DNA invertase Pin-like site-specific DNA recombinase
MGTTISPGWATYLRVSDEDKQSPERSFAMQRHRIEEQLLSLSQLSFKREYRDMLTGTTPNRQDYQLMLTEAEAGSFSHLGLYRADRFGRNAAEGLQAATRLIGLGIKIRVANMPSLTPETPDGFFMFLIQMGLAQREVDVLRQRTADGMEAKLRAGGWVQKAPEGYLNKERQVKSNKYERWVEKDIEHAPVIREAWELLLTGRYTLAGICEELTTRGRMRQSGRPWAWTDPKSGRRKTAYNRLHKIFHNPFYAGWVFSERFGIARGEVRGRWEPIVSTREYERGLEILRKHDHKKVRQQQHFYLLRGMLWLRENDKQYKMYVSTPSGWSRSYSYYHTRTKVLGKKIHLPCKTIDRQIPGWLGGIGVDTELLPAIRQIYRGQVNHVTRQDREKELADQRKRIVELREEEARLGRLLIRNKISEEAYDQLRLEWQEKIRNAERTLADVEREEAHYLDDLDAALMLMASMSYLFERLTDEQRALLLRVLTKRLIVNCYGEIVDYELNTPFTYLHRLVESNLSPIVISNSSKRIHLGAPPRGAPCDRRSSPICGGSAADKGFESSQGDSPSSDITIFLSGLRFEHRDKLADLPLHLVKSDLE